LRSYYRFEADGTIRGGDSLEERQESPLIEGWFEGGVYYEESQLCLPIGSYRAYLYIEEGKAVGLRFEEVDDNDPDCWKHSRSKMVKFVRVD
jgi:hypothetical protein